MNTYFVRIQIRINRTFATFIELRLLVLCKHWRDVSKETCYNLSKFYSIRTQFNIECKLVPFLVLKVDFLIIECIEDYVGAISHLHEMLNIFFGT